ncbi:Hypothetical_protein [Hexamita inflata]|uniref:Hypothetical_protein n=1 Tax=Hexamita inflata TaxID=28002 RepID=A0AA86UT75_9EUKA|nr:Hypothetical protein HINF_LOCUS51542 [Hexamita inflata]
MQLSSSHVTVYQIALPTQLILNSSFLFQLDQVTVGKEQIQELISRIKLNQYLLASLMAQVCQASYRWRQPEYELSPLYLAAKNFQMVQYYIIIIQLIIDNF